LEQFYIPVVFLLFGFAGGFLGSMLGVGGGIIFVPLFTHFLRQAGVEGNVLVKCVLANSMLTIVFTGLAASYNQYKQGTYYPKPVLFTASAGVVSSLLTTYFISLGSWYNKEKFSIVFLTLLVAVTLRTFIKRNSSSYSNDLDKVGFKKLSAIGFGTGIVTALSGLGGGIIMVPAFSSILKIDIKKAISVSTGVIPIAALPLTIFYIVKSPSLFPSHIFNIGHIVPQFIVPLGIGITLAAKRGVKLGHKLSEMQLKLLMLLLIAIVATKMLWEVFIH